MRYYDLYGTRRTDIEDLQLAVATALEISFTARNSLVKGDYYKADLARPRSVEVRPNLVNDYGEEELIEPDYADRPLLVYVDGFDYAPDLEKVLTRIPDLELLRRDTRPD